MRWPREASKGFWGEVDGHEHSATSIRSILLATLETGPAEPFGLSLNMSSDKPNLNLPLDCHRIIFALSD